jgi:DNA-binding MarR family transcriptional regulator
MIDDLVRKGLVARSEDTRDRRRKRVEITDGGVALLRQLSDSRTRECVDILMRLSPATLVEVERIMRTVMAELSSG